MKEDIEKFVDEAEHLSPEERAEAYQIAGRIAKESGLPRALRRSLGFRKRPVRRRVKR